LGFVFPFPVNIGRLTGAASGLVLKTMCTERYGGRHLSLPHRITPSLKRVVEICVNIGSNV
jgi:hypothetical protein